LKPEIAEIGHPTKNQGLSPNNVTKSSGKKVWWLGTVEENLKNQSIE
jgi:hypothetical protein